MSAEIIDGKVLAAVVTERVAAEVAQLKRDHGLTPGLAVVLVGDDPASHIYVRNKDEPEPRRRHAFGHPPAAG